MARGLRSIGINKIIPAQIDFTQITSGSAAGPGSFIALSSDGTPVLVDVASYYEELGDIQGVTAGNGLTGGGTTGTVTLNVGEGTGISVAADSISTNDSEIVHDNLSGFVANEHVDHSSVSVSAGDGLTGGGTIASTRTLTVGAGTGITVNTNDVAFDPDGGTLSTANADVDHILINDGGVFKRIAPSNINISSFNNDSSFTSNTGDMTGVSISVGTGLDISQTNTTSGDYSATINLDLTEVIANDGANRILTSDGDGTLTAESTITYDGANERLGLGTTSPSVKLDIVGESANESQVRIAQHQNGSDGPDVRFFTSRGTEATPLAVANDDNVGRINSFAYNGTSYVQAGTFGWNTDGTDGDSYFTLSTRVGGTTANRIEINAAGNIELGGTISSVGSALPVDIGGTGQTSYTNGQLLIGNTTGNTLSKATLSEGSGIDITNGAGTITIGLDLTEVMANSSTANAVLTSDGDGTLTAESTLIYTTGQLHRDGGALTISSDSDVVIDLDDNNNGSDDHFAVRNGGNTEVLKVTETGMVTKPLQPCFRVTKTSTQSNISINTSVIVTFQGETFDVGSNFASSVFTVPVDGIYLFGALLDFDYLDNSATQILLRLRVGASTFYDLDQKDPNEYSSDLERFSLAGSTLLSLSSGDEVRVVTYQQGGSAESDIGTGTRFWGTLIN